ncbi:hypothetical protein E3E11_06950 [Oecophyllibacter saccharovorans]|uniref:Uncharacterized protein n=2 Tax=Oecophyllibacter saccharovorans TaxID=2558360 RepID=A0A506UMC0_9PROT|nr:hypothetical protein [Oecophyllibacter saccharovorans]QDH16088.1 hypothetical protein E3E11_06950 [Oecophyllibacter saccharovorans]TPW34469.1 hypothetical protein E3202_08290 [Oecophyllibacter saccharovorans]TPW36651.1 hypothetical protein E3203_02510 [Oecophyllibacter saccharovorans]
MLSRALLAGSLLTAAGAGSAWAQSVRFSNPYQAAHGASASSHGSQAPLGATGGGSHGGEHFHARGHRSLPQGYQEAPSVEFENGPDPGHLAKMERDKVTGTNLTPFGSAYQNSDPIEQGRLGDATGNGWVAPRGNGW